MCPCYAAEGPLSSFTMMWLPSGASHATSRWIIVLSFLAASHSSAKGWASSITKSPLAAANQIGRWKDNLDTEGLHLVQPSEGASILLDEPFGLSSAAVMHNTELDDEHCTTSFGYRLSITAIMLGHPKTILITQPAHSRRGVSLPC